MTTITVTTSTSNVNVNSTTNEVNVTSTASNIVVGTTSVTPIPTIREAISVTDTGGDGSLSYSNVSGVITYTGPSAAEVRAHLSNTAPILYDTSTGVISIDQNAIIDNTFVDLGNQSGNVVIDASTGKNFRMILTGDLTGFNTSGVQNGDGLTIILEQDGIGGHQIDTTTHSAFWSDFSFTNDFKTLDTNPGHWNIVSVVYDGTAGEAGYYGSLVVQESLAITNNDLANSNIIVNGTTIELGSSGNIANFGTLTTTDLTEGTNQYYTDTRSRAAVSVTQASASGAGTLGYNDGTGVFTYTPPDLTAFGLSNAQAQAYIQDNGLNGSGSITMTGLAQFGNSATQTHNFTGNVGISGNLQVQGNIDYVNSEDLLVKDQSISLNVGNVAQDAMLIVDRTGAVGSNVELRWNETSDRWTFTNDGSTYYNLPASTTDVAEGTNLYYTTDRANTAINAYTGTIGSNDTFTGKAPNDIYVRNNLFVNNLRSYDTSDGILVINDNGGSDDAIDINMVLRSTNDAGTLNTSGMTIFGSQASTGPGQGNLRPIVRYDGMGNVHNYLDFAGLNNANTNTNHFTIHGIGDNDPVFKVNQNSDITIGGVITSDSDVILTGNLQVNADTSINGLKGLTFDSTNNFLGLGTTTPGVMLDGSNEDSALHIQCVDQFHGTLTIEEARATSSGPEINFVKAWYDTGNSVIAAVSSGNRIGEIHYEGYDGSAYQDRLYHNAFVDGTVSSGTIPMGWEIRGNGLGTATNKSMFKVRGNGAVQVGDMSNDDSDVGIKFQVDSGGNVETTGSIISDSNVESTVRLLAPSGIFGAFTINANSITGATDIAASGNVSGTKLSDGVLQITGGNISLIHDVDATGHFHAQEDIKSFASNIVSAVGNVTALNGNVVGQYLHGDGSNITNIPGHLTNAQAQSYIQTSGLTMTANITSNSNIETTATILTDNIKQANTSTLSIGESAINTNKVAIYTGKQIEGIGGGGSLTLNQQMLGTDTEVLSVNSVGYAPYVYLQSHPLLGGYGARQDTGVGVPSTNAQPLFGYVANATLEEGNTQVAITGIARLYEYYGTGGTQQYANALYTDAANITTILSEVAVNSIPKTGGIFTMSQAPFRKGTYITGIDSANAKITVNLAPRANATLTTIDGASSTAQNTLWIGAGAYNTEIKYAEMYVSYADVQGNIADSNYFPQYSITCSLDQFGAGINGFSTSDLTYTTANPASWTAATYTTSGKTNMDVPDGAMAAPYGLTVGRQTATSYKSFNDLAGATFGLNVGWSGVDDGSDYGSVSDPIPQIGLAGFTSNAFQGSVLSNGPRLIFQSRTGRADATSELDQYPRATQELGRISYWGTHGNNPSPSTTAAPGYISVAAADNWTDGSNTNMYMVGTSNYTDTTSRDPFLSYEAGKLILTSGQPSSVQEDIQFAPAVQVGNNPQNAYDFSSDAAAAGSKGWATMNYANVSATSGAKFSVNNGMSIGAGTVGDQVISIHRKDNSYALANTDVDVTGWEMYTAAFMVSNGGTNGDTIGLTGTPVPTGVSGEYTFSGITDSNWTFLNGNTYTFTNSGFGAAFQTLQQSGVNVAQAGGNDFVVAAGQYTFANSQSSGVTAREYELSIAEQSENLKLTTAGGTSSTQTDLLEVYSNAGNSYVGGHDIVSHATINGTFSGTYNISGTSQINPSFGNFQSYSTSTGQPAGTITLDFNSFNNTSEASGLNRTTGGAVYIVKMENVTGNAQTIATANTTPTFSTSLANGSSFVYRITQIGTEVIAEKIL